jgi:hypothetical protein
VKSHFILFKKEAHVRHDQNLLSRRMEEESCDDMIGGSSSTRWARFGRSIKHEVILLNDSSFSIEYNHIVILVLLHHLKVVKVIIYHITKILLICHMDIINIWQTQTHHIITTFLYELYWVINKFFIQLPTNRTAKKLWIVWLCLFGRSGNNNDKVTIEVMIIHTVLPCGD